MVCTAPHNLASGQLINITSGSTSFNVSSGVSSTYADNLGNAKGLQVFPTGPTTFAFTWIGSTDAGQPAASGIPGESMPGGMNNVAGSQSVSYVFELVTPDPGVSAWECAAQTSGSFPGCNHYVNIPAYATDATAAVIAQRVRDNFPKGRKVTVEYWNENWNFGYSELYTAQMGNLGAWGTLAEVGNPNGYVVRAAQHHATFVSVFNAADIHGNTNRGGEIVRMFGGWMTQPGRTTEIVSAANTYNASVAGSGRITHASLWADSVTPGTVDSGDNHAYEMGTRFQSAVAGFVTGVRFYKAVTNTGTHIGHLWTNSGTILATVTFTGETASGWQQASFGTPVSIAATTNYVISYWCPNGHYSQDTGYFASPLVNGNLTAPASISPNYNGVYNSGSIGFPMTEFGGGQNYWADLVFSPASSPTVVAVTPTGGTTGVSNFTPVITAQFDEPVQGGTISFTLNGGSSVAGVTTYNSTTWTATFVPSAPLTGLTVYTATVSGAEDLSNNPMASPFSWSFTTLTPFPLQIDAVCVAPYMDVIDEPNGSFDLALAAASLASGHSTSIAYQWATPWTRRRSGTSSATG